MPVFLRDLYTSGCLQNAKLLDDSSNGDFLQGVIVRLGYEALLPTNFTLFETRVWTNQSLQVQHDYLRAVETDILQFATFLILVFLPRTFILR